MLNCLSQCDKHLKGHAGAAQCTFTYLHVESLREHEDGDSSSEREHLQGFPTVLTVQGFRLAT
jgi:hypothetical protein